jgi:hypothetical protein
MTTPSTHEPVKTFGNFIDQRHCLYVGWVLGIASKHGFDLRPLADDEGNWTDRIEISMKPYAGPLTLIIPYPPDDWEIAAEGP